MRKLSPMLLPAITISLCSLLLTLSLQLFYTFAHSYPSSSQPNPLSGYSPGASSSPPKEIALVVPAEHHAMDCIIEGFRDEITKQYEGGTKIEVYRAYGETALLQAAMQKIAASDAKVVLPIGTHTALTALRFLKNKPVIHLAAKLGETERRSQSFAGVLDEVSPKKVLLKAKEVGHFRKIALVHSASEKTFPEVEALKLHAQELQIELKEYAACSAIELYSTAAHIDEDCDLILILKDHLVVSCLPSLLHITRARGVPLMACDEGSVNIGATMALAIKEEDIGRMGAVLCARFFHGETINELPILELRDPKLLVNFEALKDLQNEEVAALLRKHAQSLEQEGGDR